MGEQEALGQILRLGEQVLAPSGAEPKALQICSSKIAWLWSPLGPKEGRRKGVWAGTRGPLTPPQALHLSVIPYVVVSSV